MYHLKQTVVFGDDVNSQVFPFSLRKASYEDQKGEG